MKSLLVGILILFSVNAYAQAVPLPSTYIAHSKVSKNRRVAVITSGQMEGFGSWQTLKQYVQGLVLDRLVDTGEVEVYYFSSSYFYTAKTSPYVVFNGTHQWHTLGDYFGVAVVVGMISANNNCDGFGGCDNGAKFFNPESTNIQVVHIGEAGSGWSEFFSSNRTGASVGNGSDKFTVGASSVQSGGAGPHVYFTTYSGNKDTISGASMGARRASLSLSASPFIVTDRSLTGDSTAIGVWRIVRLFKPSFYTAQATKPNWMTGAPDSTQYEQWYSDSIVHGGEIIPLAWRVYWKPVIGGYATVDTPWVDYVTNAVAPSNTNTSSHIMYSVISRYIDTRPTKVALEWDDVGNMGLNPSTPGGAWAHQNPRWPNPTLMAGITNWLLTNNVKVTLSGEADTLKHYAQIGKDSMGVNSYYKHDWLTYYNIKFVNHVHDTLQASGGIGQPFTNPLGRGSPSIIGGDAQHHIMANAYNPNAWPYYGIYNKLKLQDSLHTTWRNDVVAPYLSFANDTYLPRDWRTRLTGSDATAQFGYCPPESFFVAFSEAKKYYIRGYVVNQDTTSFAGLTTATGARYFAYPGEQFITGANKKITNTGTIAAGGGIGNGLVGDTRALSASTVATLLGTINPIPRLWIRNHAAPTNEISSPISWDLTTRRNIGVVDRIRVWYQHPKNYNSQGVTGSQELYNLQFIIRSFDALSQVAGKPIVKWVYPWETYQ